MARGSFYTTEKIGPKQSLTPEGFLLCEEVAVARTGQMIYGPDETPIKAGPDGITKIFREATDVFAADTIASAQGKSVANDHPDEDVTPENWKDLTIGIMLNVRRGTGAMDDLLLADLLVTTPEGIEAVRGGKMEVSLGYEADYEEVSPGVGKQSNIIINHVAIVEQGRCGPRCAIKDHKSKELTVATKKHSKILDTLMRAFKAKDADEVEKLSKEVADDIEGGEGTSEGATHIHVHAGGTSDEGEEGQAGTEGRTTFTDEDLQEHMDKNSTEHAEMFSRIEELEKLVAKLSGGTSDEGEDDHLDEEAGANLREEAPEGTGDEAVKAKDSAYLVESFSDTVAMAEILVPGIRIPTCDRAAKPTQTFKKICGLRKQALDLAYVQPTTRSIIDDLLAGKDLDTKNMTCDAVRVLFRGAAAAKRVANNTQRGNASDKSSVKAGPMTIAEVNRRNAERYKL